METAMSVQNLIEKYKKKYAEEPRGWGAVDESRRALFANFINDLEQLDEPKKVVVPKFVAEYIEIRKKDYEVGGLGAAIIKVLRSCNEPDLASWMNNNTEVFARAWHDGYEVEKESRYYVKVQESYIVYIVSNKEIHMKKCKQELATTFTDKKAAEAVAVLFDGEVEEE